jgi:hypothetical protein
MCRFIYILEQPNIKPMKLLCLLLLISPAVFAQSHIYDITNCGGEIRTALYTRQLSNVTWCLKGDVKFKESIILKYSSNSHINLDSLEAKAVLFRKALPKNYWEEGVGGSRLNTQPNEDGTIWFDKLYVTEDGKGNFKILASCKVIFEGTDPVKERIDPKIQDIIVITDKKALLKYNAVLKKLMIANDVKPLPPVKK